MPIVSFQADELFSVRFFFVFVQQGFHDILPLRNEPWPADEIPYGLEVTSLKFGEDRAAIGVQINRDSMVSDRRLIYGRR